MSCVSDTEIVDLIVRTASAKRLDEVLQQLPMAPARVVDGTWDPVQKTCHVRAFGNVGFLRFALPNQGYGEIIGEIPAPASQQARP